MLTDWIIPFLSRPQKGPPWILFPGSDGIPEMYLSLGFILLSFLLLKLTDNRKLLWTIIGVYLFSLVFFTLLTRSPGPERSALLSPFSTIRNALDWKDGGPVVVHRMNLITLILNLLLFIPFGYLIPKGFRRAAHFYIAIPAGLLTSLAIETTQYFTRLGQFDVDDLITNTLGAALGYLLFFLFLRKRQKKHPVE